MKVVYILDTTEYFTHGKIYEIDYDTQDDLGVSFVTDDNGTNLWTNSSNFMKIEDWRSLQIDKFI